MTPFQPTTPGLIGIHMPVPLVVFGFGASWCVMGSCHQSLTGTEDDASHLLHPVEVLSVDFAVAAINGCHT